MVFYSLLNTAEINVQSIYNSLTSSMNCQIFLRNLGIFLTEYYEIMRSALNYLPQNLKRKSDDQINASNQLDGNDAIWVRKI